MRNRLVAVLVASLLGTACGGADATGASAPTATSPPNGEATPTSAAARGGAASSTTTVRRTGPPRVLFAGDSLMEEIHAATAAAVTDSVETKLLLSPQLIRDEAQRLIWETAIDDFDPDVVVVLFSHWERLIIGAQGPDDVDDLDAYAGLVAFPFAEFMAESDVELIWLGAPPLRSDVTSEVYTVMNDAFRAAARAADNAEFVELDAVLTDETGAFAESLANELGLVERVRRTDGIHFCAAGAIRVAEALLPTLADRVDLVVIPGWQNAPWSTEAPFDDPEECPPG